MSFFRTFGFGERRIIAQGNKTRGDVTAVKTCWWLKVNTKPARINGFDGAVFPHIVHFTYKVDGKEFKGSRYFAHYEACPHTSNEIMVYYDPRVPAKCALKL